MANAEAMAKANDKRINVIEKKMDALEKATRAAGNFSTLEKRVSTLESLVKALAASTKAGGGDKNQAKVTRDVEAMKKILADNQKTIKDLDSSKSQGRIDQLNKSNSTLETGIKTLSARQEKHRQEQVAAQKKIADEQVKLAQSQAKQAQDIQKAVLLESRLKALEGMVQAALSK